MMLKRDKASRHDRREEKKEEKDPGNEKKGRPYESTYGKKNPRSEGGKGKRKNLRPTEPAKKKKKSHLAERKWTRSPSSW